jgi:alpha/beta hydrolase family protein/IPT/TIG domain-containing protein
MPNWTLMRAVLLSFALALCQPSGAASVPNPTVTGPIPASVMPGDPSHDYPFLSTTVDLAGYGYVEEEFFFEGTANRYNTPALATGSVIDNGHPYRTRMVVRRPVGPPNFNGTLLMEWQNVTVNYELDALWAASHDHFMRRGYAWIGVSAQRVGIHGPVTGLKAWSPGRYGTLDVTQGGTILDDALSYDIFSQAAQAVRSPRGTDPMGGLQVKRVIAMGWSQSAGRLITYHNSIHPLAGVFDTFLIVMGGGVAIGGGQLRTDLDVKVFKLLSESEIAGSHGQVSQLRESDSNRLRRWEVAGAAALGFHDIQEGAPLLARDFGRSPSPQCDLPPFSRIPAYFVLNATMDHLIRWVTDNIQPPTAPPIQIVTLGPPVVIARDTYGNALGGIRLSQHAVPIATNTGVNSGPGTCNTYGTFQAFDEATLHALYPDHMTYVVRVVQATLDNLRAGFIVPEDTVASIWDATHSDIAGVATPAIATGGVVNAATYAAGPLASNTIVSIFGTNLATVTALRPQTGGGYPTNLFGTKVTFGLLDAQLLYISPLQINAVVPAGLAPGNSNVTVTVYGTASRAQPVTIAAAGPG